MAVFKYERQVHYYETDKMGIVHHSNYIRWMEEARIAALAHIGLPYDRMEQDGILVPVLSASCNYRLPFRFGDSFVACLKPKAFNGIKLTIIYEIFHKETGQLHANGETSHCFTDDEIKLINLKKLYPDVYEGLQNWNEENND